MRSITRSKTDPLCRKVTGPVWRRCANNTFSVMTSPRLGDPGVVPRKNGGCEYAHHLENGDCLVSRVYIYVCLAASSNKRMFLREELTSLPKWFDGVFACL